MELWKIFTVWLVYILAGLLVLELAWKAFKQGFLPKNKYYLPYEKNIRKFKLF